MGVDEMKTVEWYPITYTNIEHAFGKNNSFFKDRIKKTVCGRKKKPMEKIQGWEYEKCKVCRDYFESCGIEVKDDD